MFYSQFILAKKGPLGTIWIAAHLERKLRKNQVADTDIGVSVDSIICPEVPIALRLSSHLLLGVVRIYSKKVNYLFHDCSEALLKIKQAFRSTAVDLPPEESTAPYHSITLPETFGLDDFELPDAVLQGNFVDHHVSTREQITLQDKVENILYSATEFGLDERFGDGDTSHIGLDLDEGLFLKKDILTSNASGLTENVGNQLSAQPETPFSPFVDMDVDDYEAGCDENKTLEGSMNIAVDKVHSVGQPNLLQEHMIISSSNLQRYNIRTPDLNEVIFPCENTGALDVVHKHRDSTNEGPPKDLLGPAQAPSTPGLLEEAIPVHLQDGTSSHQGKSSPSNDIEDAIPEKMQVDLECHDLGNKIPDPSLMSQYSGMPLRSAVEQLVDDSEKDGGSVMIGVLQNEHAKKISGHLDMPSLGVSVEADTYKGLSQELRQDSQSAPLTSDLALDGGKLASIRTSEISHSLPVHKPELCNSIQSKPAAAMLNSYGDQMISHNLGSQLKPCAVKDQINSAIPEDQVMGDSNNQLTESLAEHKMPQVDSPSLQEGQDIRSASPMTNGLLAAQMAGNVSSISNCSANSWHPVPESAMSVSIGTHGVLSEREQYIAGKNVLEPVGIPRTCSSLPVVERYIEPQKAMGASSSSHGFSNETGQYISEQRVPELMGTCGTFQNLSVMEHQTEPQRTMTASTSSHGFQERNQYISGQRVPLSLGTSSTCNSQSVMERFMTASTSSHGFPNDTRQHIAGQILPEPVRTSDTCNNQADMEHYIEPERATAVSTSSHTNENKQYIAGHRVSELIGVSHTCRSQSAVEHCTDSERAAVTSTSTCSLPSETEHHMEPGSVMMASTSTQGPDKEQYIGGQRMLQPVGFPHSSNIQPAMERYPEPERLIMASPSTHAFPNEAQQYSAGQRMSEPAGISRTSNSQSVMEHYTEPGGVVVASTSNHAIPNETDKYIAGFKRLEPFGTSLSHNSQPVMDHYPEPQRVMMASTSTQLIPNETEQYIAGKKMFDPTGSAHAYVNVPISGHYPEPERVMLASSSAHIFTNISDQSTAGKRTIEIDRSAHINHNLSSTVLSFEDGTPSSLIGSSTKLPGLSRSKRKASYIPDDEDLLASILVGKKRSSSSKVNGSPAFQLLPSSKRPRLTPKQGVPKRKALIDDTMVLHADIIRQQLMNTDDLRRVRKKAPCTRLETWMIQKFILEDEIFNESVLTGMSPVLASFQCQIYTHNGTIFPVLDSRHSPLDASKVGHPVDSELPPRSVAGLDNMPLPHLRRDDASISADSSRYLATEVRQESVYVAPVNDAGDYIVGKQDTARLHFSDAVTCSVVSMDTHNSNYGNGELVNIGTHSVRDIPLNALKVGLDNLTVAGIEKDDAGVSVDSSSHLTIDVHQKSVGAAPAHVAVDPSIDSQDTVRLHSSSDAVTCSIASTDTHSRSFENRELVKNMGAVCADSCSINDTPLVNKDKDIEASHVTISNGSFLELPHESFEGTALPSFNDESKCRAEEGIHVLENNAFSAETGRHVLEKNTCSAETSPHALEINARIAEDGPYVSESKACSSEYGRHVLESRSGGDIDNNVETSTSIVSEEHHLSSQPVPFVENYMQNEIGHVDLSKTDMGYQASENRSVIIDEMQPALLENEMDVDIREQQMNNSVEGKAMSPGVDCKAASLSLDDKAMFPFEKSQLPSSDVTSTLEEAYGAQELNQGTNMQMENAEGAGVTRDSNDLTSTVDENDHDTEFLNIDDEVDFDEEVDYDIPNPSEDQTLENSGWSTRTRGVARYLKLLFDDETGYGRRSVQLDRLLIGKTRKEASRMFFETLVLKTKDYIHVEQEGSSGSICIEPRSKLLKSTF